MWITSISKILLIFKGGRIKQVRSVLEHIGLYVGLAVYTAAGAKVSTR